MELIITKENFSEEFKDAVGIVDSDVSFKRLKPSIELSSEEMIELIGDDNYTAAVSALPEDPFKQLVKTAILMKALIIYLPAGDLTIGNNGRTMRRDDNSVSAFQWQIEKHDNSLEQTYYRILDRLLKFMIKDNKEINLLKYDYKDLIVNSLNLFEAHFNIEGSHLLYLKLIPALREAEKLEILPRAGKDILEEIKTDPKSDLAFLVQKCIVNYAMSWGINKLNLQLFPKGVLQNESEGSKGYSKKSADGVQRQGLAISFNNDLDRDLKALEKEISKKKQTPVDPSESMFSDFGFNKNDGFVDV
ncbi:hypothetical protein CMU39_14220 [Elizabethkingia anophelis]|nr:hypothetical protein [Elizabethkingia anophelis]